MKSIVLAFAWAICLPVVAQNESRNASAFIRVFDLHGNKVCKGTISSVTDSTLQLQHKKRSFEFAVREVGRIKTRRSTGNSMLAGAITGAVVFGVIGASAADPDTYFFNYSAGEGALWGGILGSFIGTAFGALVEIFYPPETFEINGEIEKWTAFKNWTLGY